MSERRKLAVSDRVIVVQGCRARGISKGSTARVAKIEELGAEFGHSVRVTLQYLNGFEGGRIIAWYARHRNRLSDPVILMNDGDPTHKTRIQVKNP
jgi:hypothetical protein